MTPELLVGLGVDLDGLDKGLQGAMSKFEKFGSKFENIGKKITVISGALAATVGVVAGGIMTLAKSVGNTADRLLDLHDITGATTEQIQEWQYVAKIAGVNTETYTNAVEGLTRRLKETGENGSSAEKVLRQIGISTKDSTGELKNGADIVEEAIIKLSGLENITQRNTLGSQLFGGVWRDVAPILSLGAEGIENLKKEAGDLGLILSGQSLNDANEFRQGMVRLSSQFESIKNQVGSKLAPILTQTLTPAIEKFVIPALNKLADYVVKLVTMFNDLDPSTKKVIAVISGLALSAGPLLMAFGMMIPAITAIGTALSGLSLPVVALGAGIVALASLIINNWDYIKDTLIKSGLWDTLSEMALTSFGIIGGAFDVLKGIFTASGESIIKGFIGIFSSFQNLIISSVQLLMKTIGQAIEGLLKLIGANEIGRVLNTTVVGFSNILNVLKAKVPDGGLADGIEKVKETIKTSIDKFKSFGDGVSGIGDKSAKAAGDVNRLADALRNLQYLEDLRESKKNQDFLTRHAEGSGFSKMNVMPLKNIEAVRKEAEKLKEENYKAGQVFRDSLSGTSMGDFLDNATKNFADRIKTMKDNILPQVNSLGNDISEFINKNFDAVYLAISMGTEFLGDVLATGLASIFNKNVKFDFKGMLSQFFGALGDMFMRMATPLITGGILLNIATPGTGNSQLIPGLKLAGLATALKAGGMAIGANGQSVNSGASNVKPYMAGSGQGSVEFKIDGASLVGVLNATNRLHG